MIRKWHPGKLIVLWCWAGVLGGLALADFLNSPIRDAPAAHLVEFLFSVALFLAATIVTWVWLGGKDSP